MANFLSNFSLNHNFGNILIWHLQLIAELPHHLEIGSLSNYLLVLLLMEEIPNDDLGCREPGE